MGYNAIAKVSEIIADATHHGRFFAIIEAGSYIELERFVPFRSASDFLESDLQRVDGELNGGLSQWAVRPISDHDFGRILARGFENSETEFLPRVDPIKDGQAANVVREEAAIFDFDEERLRVEQTVTRVMRDRIFRKRVLDAYDSRCSFTGLKFINGGGRAEVEAAHIKPVSAGGPDSVRNGLALSGTIHWMFDRGLIGLSDQSEILVSRHVNNPDEVWRLVRPDRRALLPAQANQRPYHSFLDWHRQSCFKN